MEYKDFKMINVEEALKMVGGYEQVYKKLVETFLENQKNLVEEVKETINTDKTEARRLVHSCKGISNNIGAQKLFDVTKDLELAILNEDDVLIQKYFKDFEVVFTTAYNELNSIKF